VKDGVFDHHNTSTKNPDDITKEVVRVLSSHSLGFVQKNYVFVIASDVTKIAELSGGKRTPLEVPYEDAGDSSDGGARDSLEESPEDLEELASAGGSSSPSGKQVRFELEICRLGPQLHGLRLKRLQGDIWLYKDFCDRLLSEMRL